jgi:hypothetical protein
MTLVKFTLSCPHLLAEQVVEFLLDNPLLQGGFTTLAGNGHGQDFSDATLREEVRGRIAVTLVTAVLPANHVLSLLAGLRAQFKMPHARYWIEPVLDFGELA